MHFIIRLAEALGRLKGAKAQRRIVALLDPPMTLLNRIVQAGDHRMLHFSPQLFFNRPGIGVESIGEHLFWGNIGNILSLPKEGFRRRHISRLTQSDIHQIPILIDAAIEITPPSPDSNIGLIHMPDVAHFPPALGSQFIREERRKACFPIPHCLVSEFKTSHQKEFRHISAAQLVAQSTQQNLEDDIGGKFQKIEGSAGAFIECAATILAVEDGPWVCRLLLQFGDSLGAAVRAVRICMTSAPVMSTSPPPSNHPKWVYTDR